MSSSSSFPRLGLKASGPSVAKGISNGSKYVNEFLVTKSLPSADKLNEMTFCDVTLFQEFAGFLMQQCFKTKRLNSGTCLQYLSSFKSLGMKRFPGHSMWNEQLDNWMSLIRFSFIRDALKFSVDEGVALTFKAVPIGPAVLLKIGERLLQNGSNEAINRWAKILLTFKCVGRSSELSVTKWEDTRFDLDNEMLCMMWPEIKTGQIKTIPICFDLCLETDVYIALGCNWICGGGSVASWDDREDANYLWPDLLQAGIGNSKINDYLQDLVIGGTNTYGCVEELNCTVVGKSLRRGAVNFLIRQVGTMPTISFVNWAKDYNTIEEYYELMDTERFECARALSGHTNFQIRCLPPRCAFLSLFSAQQLIMFNNMLAKLFNLKHDGLKRGELVQLPRLVYAVMLYHCNDFIFKYGSQHNVIMSMKAAVQEFNFTLADFQDWINIVAADYSQRNASTQVAAQDKGGAAVQHHLLMAKLSELQVDVSTVVLHRYLQLFASTLITIPIICCSLFTCRTRRCRLKLPS